MINIKDYYLDINLIFLLDKDKYEIILGLYNQLINAVNVHDVDSIETYFNTLLKSGYLKNKSVEEREGKIGELIRG